MRKEEEGRSEGKVGREDWKGRLLGKVTRKVDRGGSRECRRKEEEGGGGGGIETIPRRLA